MSDPDEAYGLAAWEGKQITVCSNCLTASCWAGEFCCDQYRRAGTVKKTVRELRKLAREHPSYWVND